MGSADFMKTASGKTAKEAFKNAVEQAQYDHGHSGYTGTIAEKDSFVMIPYKPGDVSPHDFAANLMEDEDPRINDKWGPAGCIDLGKGNYLFFGWASE